MVTHSPTVRQELRWAIEQLQQGSSESPRLEAELLVAHVLTTERLGLYLAPERALTSAQSARLHELVQRRCRGEPLQYLIGSVDFYTCRLKITPAVFIPRPETEELVELLVSEYTKNISPMLKVLDLGTGSGAIAIALARAWPESTVVAVDLSGEALAVARENALLNGVSERIRFLCSDWFSKISEKFDLIVSNPPYVPTSALAGAQRELRYEPRLALDGGQHGLDAISRIIEESPKYLDRGGALYLEVGSDQGARVRSLMSKLFERVDIINDLSGQQRFARAKEQRCLS